MAKKQEDEEEYYKALGFNPQQLRAQRYIVCFPCGFFLLFSSLSLLGIYKSAVSTLVHKNFLQGSRIVGCSSNSPIF